MYKSYLLKVANHVVAVVDGRYYDTWDSGYKSLYGHYEKRERRKNHESITDR